MTSRYRHRRTPLPGTAFPSPIEPGEIVVNTANRQIAVGDAAAGTLGIPKPLIGVRFFDPTARYVINDVVVQAGKIYSANGTIPPGPFNPTQWTSAAGAGAALSITFAPVGNISSTNIQDAIAELEAEKVARAGDSMSGRLLLSADPTANLHAATKQYVDAAAGKVLVSTTPPPNPLPGTLWWESDHGDLYLFYADVDSSQWILASPQPNTENFVKRTGDTMTGHLALPVAPAAENAVRKDYVDGSITTAISPYALKDSPVFIGNPRAPTPPLGDNDDTLATTAFVIANGGFTTGDVKLTFKTVADVGWVMMNDTSIGNPASNSFYATAECHALFVLFWNNIPDAYAPVGGGRGSSAENDWAANKSLVLPRTLGRALVGAGSGNGLTARPLGASVGAETHVLSTAEMAPHTHGFSGSGVTGLENQAHSHSYLRASSSGAQKPASGGTAPFDTYVGDTTGAQDANHNHNFSISGGTTTGAGLNGAAHNNMQPSAFINVTVKL